MKRFLSFILMLSLVLSCSLIALADNEAYDITYDAEEGVLVINNLQADAAGRIVVRFDANVTVYANEGTVKKPKMALATAANSENIWWDSGYSVAATYYAEDKNYKYIGVDWYNTAKVNTSEDAEDYLFWITVDFDDETKLDKNSIVSDFDVSAIKDFLPTAAGMYGSTLAGISPGIAMPVSFTYPNSDKGDEPQPSDWKTTVTTDKPADATSDDAKFEYRTDAKDPTQIGTEAPAKRVVVFAKNTTGAPLLAQTYGVTFGRSFYPGVADVPVDSYWSIILVDTDGTYLTEASYSYTAKVGTEEAAAGTVNVQ